MAVDRLAHGADVDTVTNSNASGAKEATLHLAAHGHRRIAALTDLPTIGTSSERMSGYEEGLAAAGPAPGGARTHQDGPEGAR